MGRERISAAKVKPCKQRELCPFWASCKFSRNANACRLAFDANDDNAADIEEID